MNKTPNGPSKEIQMIKVTQAETLYATPKKQEAPKYGSDTLAPDEEEFDSDTDSSN